MLVVAGVFSAEKSGEGDEAALLCLLSSLQNVESVCTSIFSDSEFCSLGIVGLFSFFSPGVEYFLFLFFNNVT